MKIVHAFDNLSVIFLYYELCFSFTFSSIKRSFKSICYFHLPLIPMVGTSMVTVGRGNQFGTAKLIAGGGGGGTKTTSGSGGRLMVGGLRPSTLKSIVAE